jgi:hypothetical protein
MKTLNKDGEETSQAATGTMIKDKSLINVTLTKSDFDKLTQVSGTELKAWVKRMHSKFHSFM